MERLDKTWRETKPEVFDTAPDELFHDEINPKVFTMSDEVIEDALFWAERQRGIWLILGAVGSGKGALINSTAFKCKFFFGRTPILDYKPTEAFGYYELFNTQRFVSMLEEMSMVAKGEVQAEVKRTRDGEIQSKLLEDLSHEWFETKGKVMFQHSVLVLDEFKRYMDRRRPHRPIGLVLGDLFTIWRHLDILILCATTYREYIDRRAFREMTTEARCIWLGNWRTLAKIYPVKYIDATGVLEKGEEMIPYRIDIAKPREILDGKAYKDIFNTTNLIALNVPKSLRKEG